MKKLIVLTLVASFAGAVVAQQGAPEAKYAPQQSVQKNTGGNKGKDGKKHHHHHPRHHKPGVK